MSYTLDKTIVYHSGRYNKTVTVPKGFVSDGATYALDICPKSWYVHDWMCGSWLGRGPLPRGGVFDDGSKMTNWQCSKIFSDILKEEGYLLIPHTRFWATWLFGGGKARDNGMW